MLPERRPVRTTRPHFSFSQLWLFLSCSMKYYFRYVEGIRGNPALNMTRGTAGHKALELNARYKMANKVDQSSEEIIDNFWTAFDAGVAEMEADDFLPGDNPGKEKDLTTEILRVFRLDPDHAAATTPLSVELDFTVPLDADIKPITGKIDIIQSRKRIVTPNGRPVKRTMVLDNKFPARKPSNVEMLAEMSDQLTMYDLVMTRAGVPTVDLGFQHFIPPTQKIGPRIERTYRPLTAMTPDRRAARHERLLYKLKQAARQIAAGIWQFQDDPRVCSYCDYRKVCQGSLAKDDYTALLLQGRRP